MMTRAGEGEKKKEKNCEKPTQTTTTKSMRFLSAASWQDGEEFAFGSVNKVARA